MHHPSVSAYVVAKDVQCRFKMNKCFASGSVNIDGIAVQNEPTAIFFYVVHALILKQCVIEVLASGIIFGL